jgi:hypothetical protein
MHSPAFAARKTKSRSTKAFQSTGSESGSVEPMMMEAAGIEPASADAPE